MHKLKSILILITVIFKKLLTAESESALRFCHAPPGVELKKNECNFSYLLVRRSSLVQLQV